MSSLELQKAKANLSLELKIISANDLSHTTHTHIDDTDNIDVYAVVLIDGYCTQQKLAAKTPIDYDGGSNPTWNHTTKFSINEKTAREGLLTIKVKLLSYWLEAEDDLYLGEVSVSVQELLFSNLYPTFANGNGNGNGEKMKPVTYPIKVKGGRGGSKGRLSFSYRFKPIPVDDTYPLAPDYALLFDELDHPILDSARSGQPGMYSPQIQTTMKKLTLEILIKFAEGIKNVNTFSDMDVYASVFVLLDQRIKHWINTPIAYLGYTNPKWNHQAMEFPIDLELAQEGRLNLLVKLISVRVLLGDKEIGRVKVPMQELLCLNPPSGDANVMKVATYDVTGPYGIKGKLCFSYRFLAPQADLSSMSGPPSAIPRPYVTNLQVTHQSNESYGMVHGTPDYYHVPAALRAQAGPSNGPYHSHEYHPRYSS